MNASPSLAKPDPGLRPLRRGGPAADPRIATFFTADRLRRILLVGGGIGAVVGAVIGIVFGLILVGDAAVGAGLGLLAGLGVGMTMGAVIGPGPGRR